MPPQSQNDSKTEHEGWLFDGFRKRQNKSEGASLRSDGRGRQEILRQRDKIGHCVNFDTGKTLPWGSEFTVWQPRGYISDRPGPGKQREEGRVHFTCLPTPIRILLLFVLPPFL